MPTLDELRKMFDADALEQPGAPRHASGVPPGPLLRAVLGVPPSGSGDEMPSWTGRDGKQHTIVKLWNSLNRSWGNCKYTVKPDLCDATLHFGKHCDKTLGEIGRVEPGYLAWLVAPERAMNEDVVSIIDHIRKRKFGTFDNEVDRPGHPWHLAGWEPPRAPVVPTAVSSSGVVIEVRSPRDVDDKALIHREKSYYALVPKGYGQVPQDLIDAFVSSVGRKRS